MLILILYITGYLAAFAILLVASLSRNLRPLLITLACLLVVSFNGCTLMVSRLPRDLLGGKDLLLAWVYITFVVCFFGAGAVIIAKTKRKNREDGKSPPDGSH